MNTETIPRTAETPLASDVTVRRERCSLAESENIPPDGRRRVVIGSISPVIDAGRYPIKRTVGERILVEAQLFADGHSLLSAVVRYRQGDTAQWFEAQMIPASNDLWRAEFTVTQIGTWFYTVSGWIDPFKSWRNELQKKMTAGQNVQSDLMAGVILIEEAASRIGGEHGDKLKSWAKEIGGDSDGALALDARLGDLVMLYSERLHETSLETALRVDVDSEKARFSAWYELFPRSFSSEAGQHGTFKDCESQLPRIADMGFDVLYFPPIHPIGRTFRKGKNNAETCEPEDPGSPWAIGADEGGHKSVHPDFGTLEDFQKLVMRARTQGIEIALDIAFQCSPDHPYLHEHPGWFRRRPDGTIAFAENPPKKYQDIYPFNFECDDWQNLWIELKSIFEFWMGQGVRIFRVDNPHTKSLAFWEWCLADLKRRQPDLIFLAEAFTRPAVLEHLAKIGFSQSYNYFTWRNSKHELIKYLEQMIRPPLNEYLRPNFWPSTPDILPEYLQNGGRVAFETRLILAATLGASYGIYGPAFELCENRPLRTGGEEFADSEKYEIKKWDLAAPGNLSGLIKRVNRIRRENPALQSNHQLKFHTIENNDLLAYTKSTEDGTDVVLVVANLDPYHVQSGWLEFPAAEFLADVDRSYQMHDLLTGARFIWHGRRNFVELNPTFSPVHIFRLRRFIQTERDFDYFM